MTTKIDKIQQIPNNSNMILLVGDPSKLTSDILSSDEINYINVQNEKNKTQSFAFNRLQYWVFVRILKKEAEEYKSWENCRKAGDDLQKEANYLKLETLVLKGVEVSPKALISLAEGLVLGNYQFVKYFKDATEKTNSLKDIFIFSEEISEAVIQKQNILLDAVCRCRELVNEPVMQLNAVKLAENFAKMGKEAGIKVEILNRRKIESLKMGGLLAVNMGSIDPPTFTVMEWKPENAINEKPIVLVGKGVVYDTGGLNIKTGNYMETMKHDMAGAAIMASVIFAVARLNLPVYLVALMPATDNRLNGNAYVSGDVIKMHNGLSVEVINTDAEGRLILADALSYAQKYNPQLVFNAATLTGSAVRAIGKYGVVAMHAKAAEAMEKLKESGNNTYERVAEFPFWDEYADLMKSDIADLKNSGPPEAGMITAGKFLEKFTDYPFIHLDIAGVAFAEKRDSYRNLGGTGFGVRLLMEFIESFGGR